MTHGWAYKVIVSFGRPLSKNVRKNLISNLSNNTAKMVMPRLFFLIIAIATIAAIDVADSLEQNHGSYQYKIIPADVLENNIDRGQVNYDWVCIIGDLNLSNRKFKSISITNSVIEGTVSFLNSKFSEKADFKRSNFFKDALFYKTIFYEIADFDGAHFHQEANFSESNFLGGGDFDRVIFGKNASFVASHFDNFATFHQSEFYGKSQFYLSEFDGLYANFGSTQFCDDVNFASTQFNSFASFVNSKMLKQADFHASKFHDGVNFGWSNFKGKARFDRSHFSEDAQFSNIRFIEKVDFRSCKFDGPCFYQNTSFDDDALFDQVQFESPSDFNRSHFDRNLSMNGTKTSTMLFEGTTFNSDSRLYLSKANIDRFMVKWESIKDILVYDSSAYLSLVKNYRDLGWPEADDCYYQYRKIAQSIKKWELSKILDILAYFTCGYGVKVDRPLLCSLFVILGCTMIFWVGNGLKHYAAKVKATSIYDSLYFCLSIFFTVPVQDIKPVGRYRYIPIILRGLAWLLFALFIATLGKVMIK
jgi:uncharacterized protein YjbI with pentapeptide repeats